jgi:Fic family protein
MTHFLDKLQFSKQQTSDFQKKIRQLDEFKGFWKGHLNISPQILHRLKKFALITSTGASTRIEGAYLTDEEVKKLLSGLKIQKLRDRSQQEVAGYAELTKLIFDHYKDIKWNENGIKHFHKILLQYSEKDIHHHGEYKKGSNAVVARDTEGKETVIFNPTPPYLTPKEMKELVDFTKMNLQTKETHPLFIIGHFVCEFLAIHPFQDGNGRLSRALTNLLLLQEGYSYVQYVSLEKIIEEQKDLYYVSLRKSQKYREKRKHNITPWMDFFLNILIKQTEQAKAILKRKTIEDELSENQLAVLSLLQANKNKLAVSDIVGKTDINRNTVRKVLERLRDLNLIKQTGLGRGARWVVLD